MAGQSSSSSSSSNGHHPGGLPAYTTHAEIERVTTLTQTASEQTLASYEATCREILSCLKTLSKLERTGHKIPARDRVKLYYLRDTYLESVGQTFRLGREVVRLYLRHSLGEEGE